MTVADARQPRRRWAVDRQQLLILVAASVMIGSFALFILWPKHRELAGLDRAVRQQRRLLSQRVTASQQGMLVSARIPGLRKAQARIRKRLPRGPQVADFLRMMNAALAEIPAVRHEVTRSGTAETGSTPSVPLSLRLEGPFEAVYRSLCAIERLERLIRFRDVRVSRAKTDGEVRAEAELLIYYLPQEEPAGDENPGDPPAASRRTAPSRREKQETS